MNSVELVFHNIDLRKQILFFVLQDKRNRQLCDFMHKTVNVDCILRWKKLCKCSDCVI